MVNGTERSPSPAILSDNMRGNKAGEGIAPAEEPLSPKTMNKMDGDKLPVMTQANQKCYLTVRGKMYDVSKWADYHPGGGVIRQYHCYDATQIFDVFHSKETHERLAAMAPVTNPELLKLYAPIQREEKSEKILRGFEELVQKFEREGLMKLNLTWIAYKVLTTLAFLPVGLFFQYHGWYLLSALCVGIFWQQLGWLGHDFCHHQVFENRDYNNAMGLFLGNLLQGFSSSWWKDRHNSHHATTNILDADPDIDNIPMLAWAGSDLDKASGFVKKSIKYQAYYFLLILPILRLAWCFGSITFVQAMRDSPYKSYRDGYRTEAIGLALHWFWVACMLWALPTWGTVFMFFMVSELLAGFGIAIVVFFNHYSCEKYDPALAGNFVMLQLWTTRNMTPGIITDWICGGLNYQIEHHLMPTMPRHNLYKASFLVKAYCKEHNLPYMCDNFYDGLLHVLKFLNDIGVMAQKRFG